MVILIRCNDIVTDPRAMKYVRFYQEKGIEYKLIGWDRDGTNPDIPNAFLWNQKAGFNVGGFKAVKNRIQWMWFVYKTLRSLAPKNSIIHGCDLDSAFPATCYKSLHLSNKVIFDIFDWFSATLHDQKKYVLLAFRFMERFTVKHSDYCIICEPERIEQIPFVVPGDKIKLLPNIPSFKDSSFLKKNASFRFDNDLLTFSYVGGFAASRCLEELIEIAKDGYINLAIAGFGNEKIISMIESAKGFENIKYYGKVTYTDGLNISYNSDVMYAMYATNNPNHIYAAPNKLYEAMFLGKPIFTTKGTIVEKKVKKNATGFISGESKEEIIGVIKSIRKDDIDKLGDNARSCWIKEFENYTKHFLENDYLFMVNESI